MSDLIWWGDAEARPEELNHWRVGPLDLWAQSRPHEWRLAHREQSDPLAPGIETMHAWPDPTPPDAASTHRFAMKSAGAKLRLEPATADRPVVIRPDLPLHVPAGQEVTLYVSSPLWMRVYAGDHPQPLLDLPIARPSDTWFGPNTVTGEICFAGRTLAKLVLDEVDAPPSRALMAVRISNRGRQRTAHLAGLAAGALPVLAGRRTRALVDRVHSGGKHGGRRARQHSDLARRPRSGARSQAGGAGPQQRPPKPHPARPQELLGIEPCRKTPRDSSTFSARPPPPTWPKPRSSCWAASCWLGWRAPRWVDWRSNGPRPRRACWRDASCPGSAMSWSSPPRCASWALSWGS